jgi:DNA-binding IclR family transcriptional regulator
MLGHRQEQVLVELEAAEPAGTTTGAIARTLRYDQANVHITLQGLMERGFAEKDTSRYPHIYRLGPALHEKTTEEEAVHG